MATNQVQTPAPTAGSPVAPATTTPAQVPPGSPVVGGAPGSPVQRPLSASLYVGELDLEVGESFLFDIFKVVGPVASIRVCRDAVTRQSLGYAYVNFHNITDAERAIETLNYEPIKGKPCRIMWSRRDPSIRKSGVGNVFIKNLDRSIDITALYDTFSTFGNILSCKVVTDGAGNSKGFGFVHYETKEAADQAIEKVNGMLLNGKIVYVGPFIPKKNRKPVNPDDVFTNVFVKNIDESVDEAGFVKMFNDVGAVSSAKLSVDEEGNSKGFGFVNFEKHEDAVKAVETMHGKPIGENQKTLFVCRAEKKAERETKLKNEFEKRKKERMTKYQGVNLYVKNLDDSINEEGLRDAFKEFGSITSLKIMSDDKGNSKGFGFVCFSKPEEATKAVAEMNSKMLANKPIYVALAQRKEVRRQQLEAQHARNMRIGAANGMGMTTPMGYPAAGPAVFYSQANIPPQARNQFVYPPQPIRGIPPRWPPNSNGPQGQPGIPAGQPRPAGYQPAGPNFVVANGAPRGQPQGRQFPAGMIMPNGEAMPQQPPQQQQVAQQPPAAGDSPLNSQALASAAPAERRQMLGDALYNLIHAHEPDEATAGKITGMILEAAADDAEILGITEDPQVLLEKVNEAHAVLNSDATDAE